MPRYMIQSVHTLEECVRILDGFLHAGAHYLINAEWGCYDGDHTAWLIVEASDDEDARLMIPPVVRKDARLIKLNKFTPEEVRQFHREQGH
jgi:hypothetical protein